MTREFRSCHQSTALGMSLQRVDAHFLVHLGLVVPDFLALALFSTFVEGNLQCREIEAGAVAELDNHRIDKLEFAGRVGNHLVRRIPFATADNLRIFSGAGGEECAKGNHSK